MTGVEEGHRVTHLLLKHPPALSLLPADLLDLFGFHQIDARYLPNELFLLFELSPRLSHAVPAVSCCYFWGCDAEGLEIGSDIYSSFMGNHIRILS